MFRAFLMICCLSVTLAVQAQDVTFVQLDNLESMNLVPESRYLIDETGQKGLNSFSAVSDVKDWQSFRHEQLRMGLTRGKVWVERKFQVLGSEKREVLLAFDRQIDFVDVALFKNNTLQYAHKSGDFLKLPLDLPGSNKNIFPFTLEPGADYQLLIALYGSNGITGPISLWDKHLYQKVDQITLLFFIAYAVMVLIISIYNLGYFLATKYRAFAYHAAYGAAMLLLQAAQYNYLDALMPEGFVRHGEFTTLISIAIAYTAVYLFINTIVEASALPFFELISKVIIGLNVFLVVLSLFVEYKIILLLFLGNIALGCCIGLLKLFSFIRARDVKAWKLAALIFLFAPPTLFLVLSRLGVTDNNFFTEYMLLLVIVFEMIVVSCLLFSHLRGMHQLFWRSQFLDPNNKLPNVFSLRKKIREVSINNADYALTYIWAAGLEKIELARGSAFRDKYLKLLSECVQAQLEASPFQLELEGRGEQGFYVFYCEKNTLGVLSIALSAQQQRHLKLLFDHALGDLGDSYGYNLDVTLIIATTNAVNKPVPEALMQQTAVTLSQCIQNGQSVMLYNDEVGFNELRQITLLSEFEHALLENQFYLEWQPQVDAVSDKLSGLEALVRWRHPFYGVVSPEHFIPLLEQSTKITSLSIWVLEQTLKQVPAFTNRFPGIDISVNLSVYDMMNSQLIPAIDGMLSAAPANIASSMILEITESVHMEDNEAVLQSIRQLQLRGFRISIDDFGAGYASFGYLQILPVNELKIDRRYANSIEEPNSQAIIKSIIDLATRLNIGVVIEGVENKTQQALFTKWGAQRLQGWCLGKPAPLERILQMPLLTTAKPVGFEVAF